MSRFVFHSFIYVIFACIMVWVLCLFGGPYTDPFYLRFTTPLKKSLVIGTSRAAQGIVPAVMIPALSAEGYGEGLYNYSFTIVSSPFGEPYLRSIEKKLDQSVDKKTSLFVIAVDPWSISTMGLDTLTKQSPFLEEKFSPGNMDYVDLNPNPEYIYKNIDNRVLMMIRKFRNSGLTKVEADGSLHIQANLSEKLSLETKRDRFATYANYANENKLSKDRLLYLHKTVEYLSTRGRCVLVRIPVEKEMLEIEQSFMPSFDSMMNDLVVKHDVKYLNFADPSRSFRTNDGNHLRRQDAEAFSLLLAQRIVEEIRE